MCMPPSALAAMVNAVPDRMLRDIVHDNRGPRTPTGMIPRSQQPTGGGGPANVPGLALDGRTKRLSVRLPASATSMRSLMRKMRRIVPNLSNAKPNCRRRKK